MRLFIAEKPSLARAIANALPQPSQQRIGYITAANGDVVTWCVGHILSLAEPEAYNPNYKQWRLGHLPIMPEQWSQTIKPETKKQFDTIKKLAKQAGSIVHAGDPDREGQRLVDEVLEYLHINKPVQRLLINDLALPAVKSALLDLKDNTQFRTLSLSALARERLDWLYGINNTRAYTLLGRYKGMKGVLSVGRVQTPVLGLIVNREKAIQRFKPKPYFDIDAAFSGQSPTDDKDNPKNPCDVFYAKWRATESHCSKVLDDLDESGHLLNSEEAEHIVDRLTDSTAVVSHIDCQNQTQTPPLPYSLSALQIDAANQLELSAADVLAGCQRLYEKYKLITYPRSDCRYLPEGHHKMAENVLDAIGEVHPEAAQTAKQRQHQKTGAWNDKKVSAHHAIIPTVNILGDPDSIDKIAYDLYKLISLRYLMQFYPNSRTKRITVMLTAADERWQISSKQITEMGWKALLPSSDEDKDHDDKNDVLSQLSVNDKLNCCSASVIQKQTTAPNRFTDATLLGAMVNIALYVQGDAVKRMLRVTDGLGTEATRANIIETLFKRGYVKKQGKQIVPTDLGIALINMLPMIATIPDMTAQFEADLADIQNGKADIDIVMQDFCKALQAMIGEVKIKVQE